MRITKEMLEQENRKLKDRIYELEKRESEVENIHEINKLYDINRLLDRHLTFCETVIMRLIENDKEKECLPKEN